MSISLLNKLYNKINESNNVEMYFYIIQIKDSNTELKNHKQPLYVDIKKFLFFYINALDKRDFGYDRINIEKIKRAVDKASSSQEKLSLYAYAYKVLKDNQFEVESEKLISYLRKTKLLAIKEGNSKIKYIKILGYLLSYNIYVVLGVLAFFFLISYLILLPTANEMFSFIEFHCESFSDDFYINHFFNTICYSLDINDKITISPINWQGVILISFMKLFYIIYIVNYLFQILLERIKLNK